MSDDFYSLLEFYFPNLSDLQKQQFLKLQSLYSFWNEKVNVISRKDIGHLYLKHVLHSLAIAKKQRFLFGEKVLDVGTGGGFPGIPLAILFPETQFFLVDSIAKKTKVIIEIATELQLNNVIVKNTRVEHLKEQFNFIVSRAVAPTKDLLSWTKHLIFPLNTSAWIFLKGGDLEEELSAIPHDVEIIPIKNYFSEDFFASKQILYLPFKK